MTTPTIGVEVYINCNADRDSPIVTSRLMEGEKPNGVALLTPKLVELFEEYERMAPEFEREPLLFLKSKGLA